jgi:hypothetical protein
MTRAIDHLTWSWRSDLGKEPPVLKGLRITILVVAILAVLVGILILSRVPFLNKLGTTVGWSAFAVGGILSLVFGFFKCVKEENKFIADKNAPQKQSKNTSKRKSAESSSEKKSEGDKSKTESSESEKDITKKELDNKKSTAPARENVQLNSHKPFIDLSFTRTHNFPEWLSDLLPNDIQTVKPTDSTVNSIVKAASKHSLCLFKIGNDVGLYLRVHVQHENLDNAYDEECRLNELKQMEEVEKMFGKSTTPDPEMPTSDQPFIQHLIVFMNGSNEPELTVRGPCVRHRHKDQTMRVLSNFKPLPDAPPSEELLKIHRQEDLPEGAERSLEWLLLNIIHTNDVEVREDEDLLPNFSKPAVGKWKVSSFLL